MKENKIPVQKGDILNLGVISIGANKDLMFKHQGYCLFLKNFKDKPVSIGKMIKIKVVKLFSKLGYCELYKEPLKR